LIKITQVQRTGDGVYIRIDYDKDETINTVTIDAGEIVERLKQVRSLLGRPVTLVDMRDIVIAMINEVRAGKKPFVESFRYEDYIGVDLEAQTTEKEAQP